MSNKWKIICTTATFVVAMGLFVLLILVVHEYKYILSIPSIVALIILGFAIFWVGFWTAVQGGRKIGYYRCHNCHNIFIPSTMSYITGVHFFGKSRLKCPKCGKKNWCR